jgi:hypothetical protein
MTRHTDEQIVKILVGIYGKQKSSTPYQLSAALLATVCGYAPTAADMLRVRQLALAENFVIVWHRTAPGSDDPACVVLTVADVRRMIADGDATTFTRRQLDSLLRGVTTPPRAAQLLADVVDGRNVVPLRPPAKREE